jgi:hypothetical protein
MIVFADRLLGALCNLALLTLEAEGQVLPLACSPGSAASEFRPLVVGLSWVITEVEQTLARALCLFIHGY